MKKIIVPLILFLIFGGLYFAYKKLVVWDEKPTVALKENIETSQVTPLEEDKPSLPVDKKESTQVSVMGKINVSVEREKEGSLNEIIIFLDSGGARLKEINTKQSGSAVFDQLKAGTYAVGTYIKGDQRIVSKKITLGEGEINDVSLGLYVNTKVKATVKVKNASGSLAANQKFTLKRANETGWDVTTDDNGVFIQDNMASDLNWKLFKDGVEVATFGVAPTGLNQTINVTTSSS